jgi:hypothetical protein
MPTDPKSPNRFVDTPRDKPVTERTEHANLDRPGAQAHPRARRGWEAYMGTTRGWRVA